jgi:DNA mismatch repair protein MutL
MVRTGYDGAVTRIRVLSDALVNRIAAGEVVERPASVVKELVENSLDAGAERIEVDLKNGGRSLVRVIDDGCGMDEDDALLSLERHATSKISSADDLQYIATLGFRGEAIPSIAAVSRFTMMSCADPSQGGVRLTVEGGKILGVEGAARTRGTTIEIRDLFFNLPARRKFLHAPETELRHAQETIWAAALARPEVAFMLRHGSRTLFELLPVHDAESRLAEMTRRRRSGPVTRFESSGGGLRISGLLAPGRGTGRPELIMLVNGRPVRDRMLVGAALRVLREAGSGYGGSRLVIFVEVPPDLVDVNVHPAKAEVRFARAGAVYSVLERALRSGVAAAQGKVDVRRIETADGDGQPGTEMSGLPPAAQHRSPQDALPFFQHPVYGTERQIPEPHQPAGRPAAQADPYRPSAPPPVVTPRSSHGALPDTPLGRLIGQYRSSFLLLEDEQGLAIVDQHAAHERVLYDEAKRRLAGEISPAQSLLIPAMVEVDEALASALSGVQKLLRQVGIEAELFGPDTVRLLALPSEVGVAPARRIVLDLLERATALDGVPEQVAERLAEELASSMACHAAITVNHSLAPEEQRALLRDLAATENPYRCPHGRPIVIRLSHQEMERRLGRR